MCKLQKIAIILMLAAIAGCSDESSAPIESHLIITASDGTGALKIMENGTSGTIRAALDVMPEENFLITVTADDRTEFAIDNPVRSGNPQNFREAFFELRGIDDMTRDGDSTVILRADVTAASDGRLIASGTIPVTVVDNGENGIVVDAPTFFETTETGGNITFYMRLKTPPEIPYTIRLTSSDPTEGIVEPAVMTITADEYDKQKPIVVRGVDDNEKDGNMSYEISADAEYGSGIKPENIFNFTFQNVDDEIDTPTPGPGPVIPPKPDINADSKPYPGPTPDPAPGTELKIRFMASNTTSGNHQTYDDGNGIRIMQAFKPDIVMIQEFNYTEGARAMVEETFGKEFYFSRGTKKIPNGVISKYPIMEIGAWDSNVTSDRNWDWAVIDLPGKRDLLAVSVHLHGDNHAQEMPRLMDRIEEKQKSGGYYVVIGGDFNTKTRHSVYSNFGKMFFVGRQNEGKTQVCDGGDLPVDQDNNSCTSGERDDPYDWLLFDKDLDKFKVPVAVGEHSYPHGHIIDSRVYAAHGELASVPPITASDSNLCYDNPYCRDNGSKKRTNMQHQAIVRDVVIKY